ncbi:MAG: winged helix-turn-helix domain-containing protein [Terracidiphilus sp.]|jgi:DNA-binding winged helix-turn-helix (wHTH) protein/tetratricopeptide (TPR) repeat protein
MQQKTAAPAKTRELDSYAPAPGHIEGRTEICFGSFRLKADGTLLRDETMVHLPPKELAALRLLAAHAGVIVTPAQLRKALWGDVHVTADSIPKCVSSLRARLEPEDCIQTIYKRGYRFTAEIRYPEAPGSALPRLAVLPFVSGYTVPPHLGPVIAEETISRLTCASPPAVAVLARDSVFTLAARGLTAQQIGDTLQADFALTGTVSNLPSHFRLRAEMIRIKDGIQIWVEDVLVPHNRIAGLESELIERLYFRLNVENVSISAAAEPEAEPENEAHRREAYQIFQRAHYEWQSLERHRMQDSLQQLGRATELSPSLIAAKVELVRLGITQAVFGFMPPTAAASMVRRVADSIPEIPAQVPAILPSLGSISFHVDHDLPSALWAFSKSAHLPHDPWVTRARVMFALSRCRFAEGIHLLESALIDDPFSPWLHARLAWAFHLAGQPQESVKQIRQGLERFPDHMGMALYGAMILPFNGDAKTGIRLAENLAARQPYLDIVSALHAYALACAGQVEEARGILEQLEWLSRERFVMRSFTPAVYVALGDFDAAISELHTSADARCPWFFQMLADPRHKPLHNRQEFKELRAILTRIEATAASA